MSAAAWTGSIVPRAPRRARPGAMAIVASLLIHGAVIGIILLNAFQKPQALPDYKVYRVDIYSPPPQIEGEPEAPKPKPTVIKPPEQKTVAVEKKPAATKTAPPKNVANGTGKSDVAKGRNADPRSRVGGEGLDVHIEGEAFPYPDYLENIIRQLNRYFRWNGAPTLETKVGFEIMRDGTVRNIRVLEKSGNFNFDLDAISAVESAGKSNAFGALPKGFVPDRLPVAFRFLPPGR